MSERPTLALLIPAYNAAAFLPRLLKSAVAQTKPFHQIWVYNDCSTDDTAAVAERFGAQVLSGAVNKGCSAGKNALASHVEADWVHFHDADDMLLPNFVELARKWMADGSSDVVLFDYEWRDDDTDELIQVRRFDAEELARDARSYAIRKQINPFCGLYRRDAFLGAGGYDEDPLVLYNEDVAMHVRLAFSGLSFAAESDVSIVNYRRGNSMSSSNAVKCLQAHYHVMRKALDLPGAAAYYEEIAERLWAVSGALGAHDDWPTADAAVALARRLAPPAASAGSKWFRLVARAFPRAALRLREQAIRAFRPRLRPHLAM